VSRSAKQRCSVVAAIEGCKRPTGIVLGAASTALKMGAADVWKGSAAGRLVSSATCAINSSGCEYSQHKRTWYLRWAKAHSGDLVLVLAG